jgi:UDP-2-acetamido-3-amino-2,3-dideoxy-glucuronate N-acetyltransferase
MRFREGGEGLSLKVIVVGAGYWGKNLVRNFQRLGVLYGICDNDPENRIFEQYRDTRKFTSFASVLDDDRVGAVAIATPAETHYVMAREAMESGKHVFVEKPLCLSNEEGLDLGRLAEEKKLTLMVGHLLQYHPAFLRLKGLVSEGKLGRVQYMCSNRLNIGKIRQEENILWSFAPHDISMLMSLVGEMPKRVRATGGNYLNERVADVTLSSLSFNNGIKAYIFVSWLHPYKEQKLVVVGEKAMAVFDDTVAEDKLLMYPHRVDWKADNMPVAVKENAVPVKFEKKEPLLEECSHFVKCVMEGKKPRTDWEEGLRVLKVLNALERSLESEGEAMDISETEEKYFAHESAVIDENVTIGDGTRIWHFSHIMKGSEIGNDCRIGQNVVIGPNARVGNSVKIQNNVSVYEGVVLEDYVFCGPSMVFTNVFNPRSEIPRMSEIKKTLVKRGATIGANATVICGNNIGSYAFVGAGAVVTKEVPDYALMVGNPARRVDWVCKCGEKLKLKKGRYECGCGNTYKLSKGVLGPDGEE